jgi:hypothetical protein
MNPEQPTTQPIQDPALRVESPNLAQSTCGVERRDNEALFIAALRGETVTEIGRYQVYSDYTPGKTVVFIHNPTGQHEHKYIFAKTGQHTYVVAAPVAWTAYHREILARVNRAAEQEAKCSGGGYIDILSDGSVLVHGESGDFGPGDHEQAEEFFSQAVRLTGQRQSAH